METHTTRTEPELVATLNDLLQLDHDAVQAYTVAIEKVEDPMSRETLERFRGDHERHISELSPLIREHGGVPVELAHVPTGFFKLAVQRVGAMAGDRALLLAFKANEAQSRDKYREAAAEAPAGAVADVVGRGAADEQRHYDWVVDALERLGAGPESAAGKAEAAFETVHAGTAEAVESVERRVMEGAEVARRRTARYVDAAELPAMRAGLERGVQEWPLSSVVAAAGVGYVVGRLLR